MKEALLIEPHAVLALALGGILIARASNLGASE
jgi:hypothetical protein